MAKKLGLTTYQLALCLGLGWSPDVIRMDFGFEESIIKDLSEIIGAMSIIEVDFRSAEIRSRTNDDISRIGISGMQLRTSFLESRDGKRKDFSR